VGDQHNLIKLKHRRYNSSDVLFRYARLLGFGEYHIKVDKETGLKAIIAIHNTKLGPALGGCRMVTYKNTAKAIEDALRLAYMMSLKAAISNLPHGGAKAVLIEPKVIHDRQAYFAKFAEFVNELNGRYITAVDSGTKPTDMDVVARYTSYVSCTTAAGDPAPYTALGVRRGIEAAVKYKMGRDNLEGIRVAIQGMGHVGYELAKQLYALGAKLIICDVNNNTRLEKCAQELQAELSSPEAIYDVEADVFSPCALGAILNLNTIKRLKAKIVAGSANNQLAHIQHGLAMQKRCILYAPDFVINAGGLIQASTFYLRGDIYKAQENINNIFNTLIEIFERSEKEKTPTADVSKNIALERLKWHR
jgi:leucine dehydrogenase